MVIDGHLWVNKKHLHQGIDSLIREAMDTFECQVALYGGLSRQRRMNFNGYIKSTISPGHCSSKTNIDKCLNFWMPKMRHVIEILDCEERILLLRRSLYSTFPQMGKKKSKNFDAEVLYKCELLIHTF